MSDRILETIKITPDLELVLYQAPNPTDGSYLSLRHTFKTRNQPGEVLLQPSTIPEITKALTTGALKLHESAFYHQGLAAGRIGDH